MTQDIRMYKKTVDFVRDIFRVKEDFIPLHAPVFLGNEKKYLNDTIDSTFVSSVGEYVNRFEKEMSKITGSPYSVATMNGTAALHVALMLADVKPGDLVITQAFTFVATCNALSYCNADPIFVDINEKTLGMCPVSLQKYLEDKCDIEGDLCIHKESGRVIKACVPMHTFGHPVEIDKIKALCQKYKINLVEDAAESLGSFYKGQHTGTFGDLAAVSFNGNKVVTGGSGGAVLIKDEVKANFAKHITTTAKVPHKWEYVHDHIGYNYRLPNLNSALLCAQLENLNQILQAKRKLAMSYKDFFSQFENITFIDEPENCKSNFWLNAIKLNSLEERNNFLEETNSSGIMTRPAWRLMHKLDMFKNSYKDDLTVSEKLEELIVNIPSSYISEL